MIEIKVNNNEAQKYGSQFADVYRKNKVATLRKTEDMKNLDKRRREMGMMPISVYKRMMLHNSF